ncbi:hypothetical protein DBR17_07095 [Sphingomonas sp. HMWF008]|nr:hypothetical protein DBR17_07095 [Sphingomonas sp. HMWF008]
MIDKFGLLAKRLESRRIDIDSDDPLGSKLVDLLDEQLDTIAAAHHSAYMGMHVSSHHSMPTPVDN